MARNRRAMKNVVQSPWSGSQSLKNIPLIVQYEGIRTFFIQFFFSLRATWRENGWKGTDIVMYMDPRLKDLQTKRWFCIRLRFTHGKHMVSFIWNAHKFSYRPRPKIVRSQPPLSRGHQSTSTFLLWGNMEWSTAARLWFPTQDLRFHHCFAVKCYEA